MSGGEPGLPATGPDGEARRAAMAWLADWEPTPTSLVSYTSAGRLLIVGDRTWIERTIEALGDRLACTVATPGGAGDRAAAGEDGARTEWISAKVTRVEGHLGAFSVWAEADGGEQPLAPSPLTGDRPFDLVLDLGDPPLIRTEVPPPGYVAPGAREDELERALAELPGLIGEFDKPRYFQYQADICAHGASGLTGCTRCLDVCPAGAIRSVGEHIDVDPHLCQGAGGCATACPTGAITYAYPPAGDSLEGLRRLIGSYLGAGGSGPVVLLHDADAGREWLDAAVGELPEHVLPWEVEEVGSLGLEAWLGCLAWGAARVLVLAHGGVPASVAGELSTQIRWADGFLTGLGHESGRVALVAPEPERVRAAALAMGGLADPQPATFAPMGDKRTTLRQAVDHLQARGSVPAGAVLELPEGAPFGQVLVDADKCTLCMSCASVCPASALLAGGDTPRLDLVEQNCVQCGLCETACPERCVTRETRYLLDPEARAARRVLNEDQPFHCVSCGKPFATGRMIRAIRTKLEGHWMYADQPQAVRRLEMCDECRVKDMFGREGGPVDTQGGPGGAPR